MQFEGLVGNEELADVKELDDIVACVPDDDFTVTELQLLHALAQYVENGIPLIKAVGDVQ